MAVPTPATSSRAPRSPGRDQHRRDPTTPLASRSPLEPSSTPPQSAPRRRARRTSSPQSRFHHVAIRGSATGTATAREHSIGTHAAGAQPSASGGSGIYIDHPEDITIGETNTRAGNTIAYNAADPRDGRRRHMQPQTRHRDRRHQRRQNRPRYQRPDAPQPRDRHRHERELRSVPIPPSLTPLSRVPRPTSPGRSRPCHRGRSGSSCSARPATPRASARTRPASTPCTRHDRRPRHPVDTTTSRRPPPTSSSPNRDRARPAGSTPQRGLVSRTRP